MESHCRGRRARARGGGVAAARERRQRGVGGCIRPEDAALGAEKGYEVVVKLLRAPRNFYIERG
jgi:hypothetical protein